MTCVEFFLQKKIDPEAFEAAEPDTWRKLSELYTAIGARSFDQQKKFFFNNWRRSYPLAQEKWPAPVKAARVPAKPKPSIAKPGGTAVKKVAPKKVAPKFIPKRKTPPNTN